MGRSVAFEGLTLDVSDLEAYLSAALSRGGDYADLYFEHRVTHRIILEEEIIKSATKGVDIGVGVRVVVGERTGYAHSDDLSRESVLKAARTAAFIADSSRQGGSHKLIGPLDRKHDLYDIPTTPDHVELNRKIALLERANAAARAYDRRIVQVNCTCLDETKHVLVATSEGQLFDDLQPLVRFDVRCVAADGTNRQSGFEGGGGRRSIDIFDSDLTPEELAREAARMAILQLDAVEAPAGPMEVVLGPGWPGILLHEAIGHGLEADFNRKQESAFSGLIGEPVASELCTVVDDGTLPYRRGSLNIDDEGSSTEATVLIELLSKLAATTASRC